MCINRIRLEFKVLTELKMRVTPLQVLIESDWNLKMAGKTDEEIIATRY